METILLQDIINNKIEQVEWCGQYHDEYELQHDDIIALCNTLKVNIHIDGSRSTVSHSSTHTQYYHHSYR